MSTRARHKGARRTAGIGMDLRAVAEGMRHPGADPRQWISFGLVDGQTEDDPDPEVTFDDEYGQPLVKVTLQPSMTPVHCRVASSCAGNGEGEYSPFVKGDEVIVAVPEGDERAGATIIGRLNNAIDKFPMDSVAGQDPTTNTFAFRRCRTARVDEYAGPYTMRSALTGAVMGFDSKGTVTLLNGDSTGMQIGSDVVGFSTKDGSALLQLALADKFIALRNGDAVLTLAATGSSAYSTISCGDALSIVTSSNAAAEHVLTTEAFINLFVNLMIIVGAAAMPPFTFVPPPPAPASPIYAAIAGVLSAATATPQDATVAAALVSAFLAQPQKPPAPAGQLMPGIGCAGLLAG